MASQTMMSADGQIRFDSPGMCISQELTRETFLRSPLFAISKPLNQNTPWSRYSFNPIIAPDGERFAGDICFCDGLIYSMSLCSIRPEFGTAWEQALHCYHKQLLQSFFGRSPDGRYAWGAEEKDADVTYDFAWGSVTAATDMKSYDHFIFVKFAA